MVGRPGNVNEAETAATVVPFSCDEIHIPHSLSLWGSSSPSNTKMTRQCWCLRIWAWSPKVEAQILPQSWQGTAVLGFGTLFFLGDLSSSRLCSRLLSKCFCALAYSCPPGRPVLGQGLPLVNWDVAGLDFRFQHIFVRLPLPAFVPFTSWELSMEQLFWESAVVHASDMTWPAKLCLVQHGLNASELSPAKDLLVWHMVLPADTENFVKAAQLKLVQFLGMPPVASPRLAAVHYEVM